MLWSHDKPLKHPWTPLVLPDSPQKNLRYAQNGGRWSRNICKFFLPIKASPGGLGVALIVGE